MRHILPAMVLLSCLACSSPQPASQTAAPPREMTSAAAEPAEPAAGPKMLVSHEKSVELTERPIEVAVPLGDAAQTALDIARDPNRHLVLRVEGISITAQPGIVYEVHLAGVPGEVGVLSFYGAEGQNGNYVSAFPIDAAAAQVLRADARELRVVFTPRGLTHPDGRSAPIQLAGRARFSRLTLVEE